MFERFVTFSLFRYSYYVSLTIHFVFMHLSVVHPFYICHPISRTSVIFPAYILRISRIYPAPHPFYIYGRILPSVSSYRPFYYMSCARDTSLLFPFLLLLFLMFERFILSMCIWSRSVSLTIHCVIMLHSASILSNIRSTSGINPAPYLSHIYGRILPSVWSYRTFTTVLCPRYCTFISFLLLYYLDVREICLMHYFVINTVCL